MATQPLYLAWANPVRIHWGAGCFQSLAANGPVVVLADRAALGYENETLLLERLGAHCMAWSWFQGGLASVALVQSLCDELWWDTEVDTPSKLSWSPADGYAEQAWVDPELSHSCPLRQSRDCALDTLAHALESLWNRGSNPISEALAQDAARRVIATLPLLLEQPDQRSLRAELSRASLLAGLAMSHTQTALAHALSYELTLREQMPHGEACAVWLPMVWELALGASPACDAALERVFGVPAAEGVQYLRGWLDGLGIQPRDLRATPAGRSTLAQELRSARGRNFIGSP
ncbi:MAG: iron-containing alcohol dehydrogenase [Rhodoferax sp.]|nr:iron-containing alcohol dehydrogenase [Rhodoferax sp.]